MNALKLMTFTTLLVFATTGTVSAKSIWDQINDTAPLQPVFEDLNATAPLQPIFGDLSRTAPRRPMVDTSTVSKS